MNAWIYTETGLEYWFQLCFTSFQNRTLCYLTTELIIQCTLRLVTLIQRKQITTFFISIYLSITVRAYVTRGQYLYRFISIPISYKYHHSRLPNAPSTISTIPIYFQFNQKLNLVSLRINVEWYFWIPQVKLP